MCFFFNDAASPNIYTLSLHDARIRQVDREVGHLGYHQQPHLTPPKGCVELFALARWRLAGEQWSPEPFGDTVQLVKELADDEHLNVGVLGHQPTAHGQ